MEKDTYLNTVKIIVDASLPMETRSKGVEELLNTFDVSEGVLKRKEVLQER